jgi:hypothetical protein
MRGFLERKCAWVILPWVRCLALCLLTTTGGRQPFPITRHSSHPTSGRLPMAGKLRSRITSIASQQEDGVDSEIVARAKTGDVA